MSWTDDLNDKWDEYNALQNPTQSDYDAVLEDTKNIVAGAPGITPPPPAAPQQK